MYHVYTMQTVHEGN